MTNNINVQRRGSATADSSFHRLWRIRGCFLLAALSMGHAIALHAVAADPRDLIKRDVVDVLELNHYYDSEGKHLFSQYIGWQAYQPDDASASQYHVAWWVLWPALGHARPNRDYKTEQWVLLAGHGDHLRRIQAGHFIESWTQTDPELADRNKVPQLQRVGLSK